MDAEEHALIARTQAGDREAFGELIGRYRDQIRSFAYRMTGNREDAEDLYREVIDLAFLRIGTLRKGCLFSTWLYRIVRNCYLDEQRRRRRSR